MAYRDVFDCDAHEHEGIICWIWLEVGGWWILVLAWCAFAGIAFHSIDMDCANDAIYTGLVRYRVDDSGDRVGAAEPELEFRAHLVPLLIFEIF